MQDGTKDRASKSGRALRSFWLVEIDRCNKWHEAWRARAEQICKRYENKGVRSQNNFNILWANTEVLGAAILQREPKPSVSRRYKDKDQTGREVSEILERALLFSQDQYDMLGQLEYVSKDNLLPGFGTARVRYETETEDEEIREYLQPTETLDGSGEVAFTFTKDGAEVTPEFDEVGAYVPSTAENIVYEGVRCEAIAWDKFRWEPARTWGDVSYCVIELLLDRDQLREEFGRARGNEIKLSHRSEGLSEHEADKALVYEVWDKRHRRILFFSEGYHDGPIEVRDDELKIENFWPWPEPYWATLTSKQLVPIADFLFYQDQANELDTITGRIDVVVDALKVRGVYDSSFQELEKVLETGDNVMTPVLDFARLFQGKGDLSSVMAMMPLNELRAVLSALYEAREATKQIIYEITGISDIVRGSSMASETATAQRIKGQYANLRLNKRAERMQHFISSLYQIQAEIIANHYQVDTLAQITGKEITPEIEAILRSDVLRSYKVAVESDSMLVSDEEADKESRMEFMQAFQGALSTVMPMIQSGMPIELAKEMLLFTVRGFKQARELEDAIEMAFTQQPQMPPGMPQDPMQQAPIGNVVPFQ